MREVIVNAVDLEAIASEVLHRGGCLQFAARGQSMRPTIRQGDSVVVSPLPSDKLKLGMVVLYRSAQGHLAAHRVIEYACDRNSEGHIILVCGDAATSRDERITPGQILGEVFCVRKGLRVRYLNRGWFRMAGLVLAKSRTLGLALIDPRMFLRHVGAGIVRQLQRPRIYRTLARIAIAHRVAYGAATLADAPNLASFYRYDALTGIGDPGETMKRELMRLDKCGHSLIATCHGRIVGSAVIRHFPFDVRHLSEWWLFGLRVAPSFRRAGIGEHLVRMALEKAALNGAECVNVQVGEQNRIALGLYLRLGFKRAPNPESEAMGYGATQREALRQIVLSKSLK